MAKFFFFSLAVVFLAASTYAEDGNNQNVRTKEPSLLGAYDVDPKDEPVKSPSKTYDMEDPSEMDDEAMSADLGLDMDDEKQPTTFDMETVADEQDQKIQDIKRTLAKLEKNSSKTTPNQDSQSSLDENDENDENDESDSMTPAERAIFRRIVRHRRVFYPYRFFDANNEDQDQDNDNSLMEGSDRMSGSMDGNMPMDSSMMNNMNEQSMGQQDGVVLRIPKRILKKLIRKFGPSGTRSWRHHSRRSSKRTSGLRLVRLVPVILPMSDGMDSSV